LEIGIWKFIGYWKLEFGNWKKQKVFACKSGSLLLMSILILSSIITAASTMGTITLQNLRLGIAVDNGLVALYAAESGVEDALYEIRKNETAAAALLANGTLANNASWARTITTTTMSLGKTVPINGSWEINLYEPDTSLSPLSNPIKSLRLSWAGSGSEWAEVKITPWTTAGSLGAPTTQLFSAASNPATVNLQDATAVLYRIQIKALYSALNNLTVAAYNGLDLSGSPVPLPTQITLLSTGMFQRAKQAVRAIMAHRAPLSDVFGYVLFTEEDLIKP